MIIPGQFGFNCPSGFREEAFWNIFPIGSKLLRASGLFCVIALQSTKMELPPFFVWLHCNLFNWSYLPFLCDCNRLQSHKIKLEAHLTIEWYWSKFQREIIITLKQQPSWMEGGVSIYVRSSIKFLYFVPFGL
jgi:hypothetical protein